MLLEIIPRENENSSFMLDVRALSGIECGKNERAEWVCKVYVMTGVGFCYTFETVEKLMLFKKILLETIKFGELVDQETDYIFKLHRLKGECL